MSIFETNRQVTPEFRANRQLAKANQEFDMLVRNTKADFKQFWSDVDGVTPVQVIEAMGVKAQAFFTVAYVRVQMILQIAQLLGKPELFSEADVLPPYNLTFKADGSLDTATPK